MALLFSPPASSSSSSTPSSSGFQKIPTRNPYTILSRSKTRRISPSEKITTIRARVPPKTPSLIITSPSSPSSRIRILMKASSAFSSTTSEISDFSATSDDLEEEEDGSGSPWEGAVVYRRDASVSHLEYCTTLERLGLGKLSTDTSRSRASAMGIRLTPARGAKDSPLLGGTPVLISIDVTRKKRKLKLDGILRTVISLGCNMCAGPAAECIYSNFSLLLSEEPIEEPDEINMGVIFGEDKSNSTTGGSEDEGDEQFIDLEDRLYFPAEEKEIDISKHIRDIVHVEITINAVCDVGCKGLCLKCGTNLNKSRCNCRKEEPQDNEYGPLKNLRKQMQQR